MTNAFERKDETMDECTNCNRWRQHAMNVEEELEHARTAIEKALDELRITSKTFGYPNFTPVGNAVDILERYLNKE